jgi:hypothetical protein
MSWCLVGSEMCIRDRIAIHQKGNQNEVTTMLTLLLTAILFYLTRQIIRSDEATQTVTSDTQLEELTDDFYVQVAELLTFPESTYTSRATFSDTPYLDPKKVLAIDLTLLLP